MPLHQPALGKQRKIKLLLFPPFISKLVSPHRASSLPARTHTHTRGHTLTHSHTPPDNNQAAPAISVLWLLTVIPEDVFRENSAPL